VRLLLIAGIAAVNAAVAALWPRVAYRLAVPAGMPTHTRCNRCRRPFPVGWRGWLRIGRPCPACSDRHIASWPVVSSLAATAAAALSSRTATLNTVHLLLLLAWLVVVQIGTLLALIDIEAHRLPTPLIAALGLALLVIVGSATLLARQPRWALTTAVAAVVLGGTYLLLGLLTPSGIGMGDVRLATVLGALLGIGGWGTVLLGAALPYAIAAPFAVTQARRVPGRCRQLPFGPFLIAGAIIAAIVRGL
jgi:leader peptidase (prepilin peptidase) / N-methyltransferase